MVPDKEPRGAKTGVGIDCYSAEWEITEEMKKLEGEHSREQRQREQQQRGSGTGSGGTSSHLKNVPSRAEKKRVLPEKKDGGRLSPTPPMIFNPFGDVPKGTREKVGI